MLNVILSLIVLYYLIRTGDLFRLIKKVRQILKDSMDTSKAKNEALNTKLGKENPLEILKLRYAKGEISNQEFEQMKVKI